MHIATTAGSQILLRFALQPVVLELQAIVRQGNDRMTGNKL